MIHSPSRVQSSFSMILSKCLFSGEIRATFGKRPRMTDIQNLFCNNSGEGHLQHEYDPRPIISAIEATIRLSGQSAFIIDFDAQKMIWQSKKLIYLDEAFKHDFKRECQNPYWALISEETLDQLTLIRASNHIVYNQLPKEEAEGLIGVIDYPINLRNHQLFITQKYTPLFMRSDGTVGLGFFTISPSNRTAIHSEIKTASGIRLIYDLGKKEYKRFDSDNTLTFIEKAIIHRARMGMTNEEIAKSLFLSINTIKSHKYKVFKKLHAKTITEVFAIVDNYQLI